MSFRWFALVLPFVVLAAGSNVAAQSEPPADGGTNAEIARVVRSRDAVRYSVAMSGTTIRAGAAMLVVDAPLADVRQVVTDYARYQDFMPGFQRSRILARGPSGTDVYLQVPILHGAATLWAVVRFGLPVREATGEKIEGAKTGQANVDELRATWKLQPIDAHRTLLKLEFLVVPSLPLPGSMITPQLEESAEDAVRACRDRAETQARSRAEGNRVAE
jgi:ribosome-associated toxin RatA of RatAB toxin-antitoxin module